MSVLTTPQADYREAVEELGRCLAEARELAQLLDYFATLLRGEPPDPEGPPPEAYPGARAVRRAADRLAHALAVALRAYESLPGEEREYLPSPRDLLGRKGDEA